MKKLKALIWLLVGVLLCITGLVTEAPTWVEFVYPMTGGIVLKLGFDALLERFDKPMGLF